MKFFNSTLVGMTSILMVLVACWNLKRNVEQETVRPWRYTPVAENVEEQKRRNILVVLNHYYVTF